MTQYFSRIIFTQELFIPPGTYFSSTGFFTLFPVFLLQVTTNKQYKEGDSSVSRQWSVSWCEYVCSPAEQPGPLTSVTEVRETTAAHSISDCVLATITWVFFFDQMKSFSIIHDKTLLFLKIKSILCKQHLLLFITWIGLAVSFHNQQRASFHNHPVCWVSLRSRLDFGCCCCCHVVEVRVSQPPVRGPVLVPGLLGTGLQWRK